jgi:hypothetical protein
MIENRSELHKNPQIKRWCQDISALSLHQSWLSSAPRRCSNLAIDAPIWPSIFNTSIFYLSCEERILPFKRDVATFRRGKGQYTKDATKRRGDNENNHTKSNVDDLLLWENIAKGRGAHTTVSVLEPVMLDG